MDLKRIPVDRIPARLAGRAAAFVGAAVVATACVTWAAVHGLPSAGRLPALKVTAAPKPIVVPDVRREAFVFAKGTLEDAGFAWRVVGKVHGFSANTVVAQSPAAGTKVYDTGAPLVKLTLKRNGTYRQLGQAEDASPYTATAVQPAELMTVVPAAALPTAATTRTTTSAATATVAPARTKTTTSAASAATAPAATTAAPAKPAAPAGKPASAATALPAWPKTRPPAFVVPGAKKEPLDEMPLVNRAQLLGLWLETHRTPTEANVQHFLYQHAWVVIGAKFGWWHGAEALRALVAVDRRAERVWGIGSQSEGVAARALQFVEAKSKT